MNGHDTDRECGPVCDGLDADGYGCLCGCHDTGGDEACRCYDGESMEYGPKPCPACARSARREVGELLIEQLPAVETEAERAARIHERDKHDSARRRWHR